MPSKVMSTDGESRVSDSDVLPNQSAESTKALNKNLILSLVANILEDPEIDLMSLVPAEYESRIHVCEQQDRKPLSKAARLNRQAITELLYHCESNPTFNINGGLLRGYSTQRSKILGVGQVEAKAESLDEECELFYAMLESVDASSYEVLAPLSPQVEDLIKPIQIPALSETPVEALKRAIRNSECLWSGFLGSRFVARLDDSIAVKVTAGSQTNHYKALQFLESNVKDFLAPKPLRLIKVASITVMFNSYVPENTLTEVWPQLSYPQKISVQEQLNATLNRVRTVNRGTRPLGRLDGEGVIDERGRTD